MIPPSTKEGIDDAVYGVAVWEGVDPKADRFSIYVRGLSDGYQVVTRPRRRQAGRPLQDPPDRLHPPRRRAQPQRAGDPAQRAALRVGLLVRARAVAADVTGPSGSLRRRPGRPARAAGSAQAERAGVAAAAGEPVGGRVVAAVGQAVVDPQFAAPEDDLLLGQRQQRGVDAEPARALDARPGRQVGQRLERAGGTRGGSRDSPNSRRS